jgi:hypothetical protein
MGNTAKIFVTGVITIGIVTALVYPGRNTAGVLNAAGNASKGLLGTAITGRQ